MMLPQNYCDNEVRDRVLGSAQHTMHQPSAYVFLFPLASSQATHQDATAPFLSVSISHGS